MKRLLPLLLILLLTGGGLFLLQSGALQKALFKEIGGVSLPSVTLPQPTGKTSQPTKTAPTPATTSKTQAPTQKAPATQAQPNAGTGKGIDLTAALRNFNLGKILGTKVAGVGIVSFLILAYIVYKVYKTIKAHHEAGTLPQLLIGILLVVAVLTAAYNLLNLGRPINLIVSLVTGGSFVEFTKGITAWPSTTRLTLNNTKLLGTLIVAAIAYLLTSKLIPVIEAKISETLSAVVSAIVSLISLVFVLGIGIAVPGALGQRVLLGGQPTIQNFLIRPISTSPLPFKEVVAGLVSMPFGADTEALIIINGILALLLWYRFR